jgi:hypothetical protein
MVDVNRLPQHWRQKVEYLRVLLGNKNERKWWTWFWILVVLGLLWGVLFG